MQYKLDVKEIIVDGVPLPAPELAGLVVTRNKIWSEDTGRLEVTGEMAGTIVAIKTKIEIKWPKGLTMDDARLIEAIVSSMNPFHTLRYTDMTGQTSELTVYFGDVSYAPYSWSRGIQRVENVSVSAIEK